MNLNSARVFVRDIAAAKAFYAQVLELPIQHDGTAMGYCVFKPGTATLIVEAVPADAPEDEQVLVGRFTGLSFQVADAAQAYASLSARGAEFCGVLERQPWGGVLATLRDPEGNEIQICEYPA